MKNRNKEVLEKALAENTFDVNELTDTGFSWLLDAAVLNDVDMAKTLLSFGANPSHRAHGGQTALMWAFRWANTEMIQLLIEHGMNLKQIQYFGHNYELVIIFEHWVEKEKMNDMYELLMQYEHHLEVECLKEIKAIRLKRLFQ